MTHPPQDNWQQPAYPDPADATMAYPIAVQPAEQSWWQRRSTRARVGILLGTPLALLVFCCGGLAVIGASADEPSGKKPADTAAVAAQANSTSAPAPEAATPVVPSSEPAAVPTTAEPAPTTTAPKPAKTTGAPKPAKTTASPKPVYYANCTAVRAAGKAPLAKGKPGYRAALDADGDGVACETTEGGGTAPKPPAPPPPAEGGGNDPRFSTCAKAKAAGYGPYRRGVDPEYSWYRDADNDGVVCE
ncbi:excalibur calcium-binding domain-containing protein [Micromonospora sp. NPDC049523]|uniref:excalibur calcium-binding domain-containing protein n=1 Tax=Micromonospora sp. NPDC049523 TaxID=3155921 RepID=UPI00341CD6A5